MIIIVVELISNQKKKTRPRNCVRSNSKQKPKPKQKQKHPSHIKVREREREWSVVRLPQSV